MIFFRATRIDFTLKTTRLAMLFIGESSHAIQLSPRSINDIVSTCVMSCAISTGTAKNQAPTANIKATEDRPTTARYLRIRV